MNLRGWVIAVAVAISMSGLVAGQTFAADASASSGDGDGWISLFDGKSLDGWRASEHKDSCKVEDGEIVVGGGERSHLFYDGPVENHDFKNFELKLQAKTEPGSNSGVYFHTEYQEDGLAGEGLRSAGEQLARRLAADRLALRGEGRRQNAGERQRVVRLPHHRPRQTDHDST